MSEEKMVKRTENPIAKSEKRRGFDNMDKTGVRFPEIKLMQAGSPEVKLEEFRDFGFRAGDIINSVSMEKLSGAFIPVIIWDDKILFTPMEEGNIPSLAKMIKDGFGEDLPTDGEIICRAPDNRNGTRFGKCEDCPMSKWTNGEPPKCRFNINVLALTPESSMPAVIRFSSTSYKTGTTLKSMALFGGGDVFSKKYKLGKKVQTKGKMEWYEYTVIPQGKASEDEYEMAESFYNEFSDMVITVHGEEPAETDEY